MSEQRLDASEVIFYVHGHELALSPGDGYVHGHATPVVNGKSVVTVQRDDAGRVHIVIDKR